MIASRRQLVSSALVRHRIRSAGPSRFGRIAFAALLILALAACSTKTEAQLASDELTAGLQAHFAEKIDEASAHYKECLKHDPVNKFCLFNLGVIAQAQGRPLEAENYYRLSIVQDPNFTNPLFNLAIIQTAAGATQEAIGLYRHVIELEPNNAGAHLNLGLLLLATGDEAAGHREIATAVTLDPSINVPAQTQAPSAVPSSAPSRSPGRSPGASPS
jgi:tetratricopeptide (TPR) repeat protein